MGLEPMTPCLKGRCSNQLSYGPIRGCLCPTLLSVIHLSWLGHGAQIFKLSALAELRAHKAGLM